MKRAPPAAHCRTRARARWRWRGTCKASRPTRATTSASWRATRAAVEGLAPNTSSPCRIVASNAGGTAAGADKTLPSLPGAPPIFTGTASALTQSTATLNASVNPNGGAVSDCHFEYGTTVAYEASAPCGSLPDSGTSAVAVAGDVQGLAPNTSYHFRIVASNAGGRRRPRAQHELSLPHRGEQRWGHGRRRRQDPSLPARRSADLHRHGVCAHAEHRHAERERQPQRRRGQQLPLRIRQHVRIRGE